ncbi:MAG TPA: hypothetical protein PK467_19730, partial [Candidatus Wallbacteria bacterium]|nr:hypothetical protein [Candidatus Wallbacteria bacterium]
MASGTKGKGDVSGKTIVCTSADQSGSEHSIGSSQMLLSSNITTGPSSEYLDVANNPSGDKLVIGANLNVDDKESVTFNSGSRNIQMKLEGSVNKAAVTAVKIYAGSPGFATTWLNAANPFNNTTQTYNGDFTNNGVAVGPLTINSSTTEQFKLFVTLNQALVTDGDTLKITILNGGITGAGASSLQSVSSQNELSNTLTLQKTSAVISANAYSTGNYKRNDAGKTIIDFKMTAGKYQNLSVGKLYIKNQASGTKTSFDITNSTATTPEIGNIKLYVDGVLYNGSPVVENKDKTGATDTGIIRIVLPTPIAISKGSSRSFKLTADFTSKAQNGSNIKAASDYTYYSVADFTPNLYSASDLTGSASGNEHNVQVIETIDLTLDSTSPTSNNITITPIANGAAAGAFGHIATYKLRASEAATL